MATITKVVRENRARSPRYWQGYKDALKVLEANGPIDYSAQAWQFLKELIADASSRLEGCKRAAEAAKGNFEYEAPDYSY